MWGTRYDSKPRLVGGAGPGGHGAPSCQNTSLPRVQVAQFSDFFYRDEAAHTNTVKAGVSGKTQSPTFPTCALPHLLQPPVNPVYVSKDTHAVSRFLLRQSDPCRVLGEV